MHRPTELHHQLATSSRAKTSRLRGELTPGKSFIDSGRRYTFRLPDKRRPVLVLTRDEVIDHLNEIIVAPVTRSIRGLRTEVLLTACAVNFDHLSLGQRDRFGSVLCTLSEQRWPEVRSALLRNGSRSEAQALTDILCLKVRILRENPMLR